MNKIFISHNQDFFPAIAVKRLINMFGTQGILVEDEPGTESPADRSMRLLNESQGFIAICTRDVKDGERFAPKHNVVLEIQEWQKKSKNKNIVILKEKGCELPKLLNDPSYKIFEGAEFLSVVLQAIGEFQDEEIIPRCGVADEEEAPVLSSEQENFLEFLSSCHNCKTEFDVARRKFLDINSSDWNLMINFLHYKISLIDVDYHYGEPDSIRITYKGTEYLREKKMVSKNKNAQPKIISKIGVNLFFSWN
ncbi:MAG: hypothetical protein HYZ83_02865 [Candidatus Omnitrophica bacterium]|nr:hypothetical protein [Candidatus Omnitrophota bacterium]